MEEKKTIITQAQKPVINRNNANDIDVLDLLGFYLSRLPLLIIAVVIGGAAAGLWTHFKIPDKYTATARMYMVSASSNSVVNLSDLSLGTSLSNDYVELMKTRPVIENVIEELGLPYSYAKVRGMISLSVVSGTRIVAITVTSTDPKEAMDIANQMMQSSMVVLPQVMEVPTPTVAEYAVLPTGRSSPSLTTNVTQGAIIGLALAVGLLTVVYLMDDTIKTAEDLEKTFGVMPLSVIPEGKIESQKKGYDGADGGESRGLLQNKKRISSGEEEQH